MRSRVDLVVSGCHRAGAVLYGRSPPIRPRVWGWQGATRDRRRLVAGRLPTLFGHGAPGGGAPRLLVDRGPLFLVETLLCSAEGAGDVRAAAADVGTTEALRRLGGVRRLAAEYLAANYGDWGQRPTWTTGVVCMVVVQLGSYALIEAGRSAFTAGVIAADPHAQGTYHWAGIPYLSADATLTLTGATHTWVGGAFTPLVYLAVLAAFTVGARLWRLLPPERRHLHR